MNFHELRAASPENFSFDFIRVYSISFVFQKTSASTSKQDGIIRFLSGSGCLDFFRALRVLRSLFPLHSQPAGLFVAVFDHFVAFFSFFYALRWGVRIESCDQINSLH